MIIPGHPDDRIAIAVIVTTDAVGFSAWVEGEPGHLARGVSFEAVVIRLMTDRIERRRAAEIAAIREFETKQRDLARERGL